MKNYQLVSSQRIVAKVLADFDLSEEDIKISDFREWIAEAVEKIGGLNKLVPRVSGIDGAPILEIKNHQAQLPCDLQDLQQVAFSISKCGPWYPVRKTTSTMNNWGCGSCCTNGGCGNCDCCKPKMIIQDDVLVNLTVDIIGNIDKTEALEILNTNQNTKTILSNLINLHTIPSVNGVYKPFNDNYGWDPQYNTKPGYIVTNIPCGYLKLAYTGFPMDEEGYPMIPDSATYQEAVIWYVAKKLLYPKKVRGELDRRDYAEILTNWNFHRRQAYAELMMPNHDEMESIKNTWNKLYPELFDHDTFYGRTGERQIIYHQN